MIKEISEGGSGLDLGVPVLDHRAAVPVHVRGVVERGELGGGGEIGQRHHVAGEPAPMVQQVRHVVEVILDPTDAVLDHAGIGIAGAGQLLVHPLAEDLQRDLVVEAVVEPGAEAADLDPVAGIGRHQTGIGIDLVEVFADRLALAQGKIVDLQDRHLSGRVTPQEFRGLLPVALFLEVGVETLFRQGQADLAAEGGQRRMVQYGHREPRHVVDPSCRAGAEDSTPPGARRRSPGGPTWHTPVMRAGASQDQGPLIFAARALTR